MAFGKKNVVCVVVRSKTQNSPDATETFSLARILCESSVISVLLRAGRAAFSVAVPRKSDFIISINLTALKAMIAIHVTIYTHFHIILVS